MASIGTGNRHIIDSSGNFKEYSGGKKLFKMIDNYIYLYHTNTLVIIPTYPESIADTMSATFSQNPVLSRSAPIFAYSNSGPRTMQIQLKLQRELMDMVNYEAGVFNLTDADDYTDFIIRNIQSIAVPKYNAAEKMVDPPLVAVRFGNEIFCKGVINGAVTTSYELPILGGKYNDKYSIANLSFTISEVDPYGADQIAQMGSYRGLETSLERRIYGIRPLDRRSVVR